MSPSLFILIFFLAFAGCKAVTWIGATPVEDHNQLSSEVEDLSKKTNSNIVALGGSVVELAAANVEEAKQNANPYKIEMAVKTKITAENSVKEAEKLSEVKLSKSETPAIDRMGIMGLIGSALGGNWMEVIFGLIAMATGGRAIQLQSKNKRLVEKGRKFATTPQTFDISQDKDLS